MYDAMYDAMYDDGRYDESPVYGGIVHSADCTAEDVNDFISFVKTHEPEIPILAGDTIDTTRFELNASDIEKSAINWFANLFVLQ